MIKCTVCNQLHSEEEMVLTYLRPFGVFAVPPAEWSQRVLMDSEVAIVDGKEFFIRCVLHIPIKDTNTTFEFGLWPQVNQEDFMRYVNEWNFETPVNPRPIPGTLAGDVYSYPDSDSLKVELLFQSVKLRPLVKVLPSNNPLSKDQQEGIDSAKLHVLMERLREIAEYQK